MSNHLISFAITVAVLVAAFIANNHILHWFLVPVSVCGILIGADAVAWFRGKLDCFDVKGIIGAAGYHFFFLSPVIFIAAELSPLYAELPKDWKHWIGLMGIINAVSLTVYLGFERLGRAGRKRLKTVWVFHRTRSVFVLGCALAAALGAQAYILFRFGGLSGIVAAQFGDDARVFAGAGIPRMLANSMPLLCFFGFLLLNRHSFRRQKSLLAGLILLTLFGCFQFAVSGAYSSRGMVVTCAVWAVILIHYFWHPINAKQVVLLIVPLVLVGWLYSFYKDLGPRVFDYLQEENALQKLEKKTGRTFAGTLIGDLSRADVHAYMLYRLETAPEAYDFRYGLTYLGDFIPMIPYWIWRDKPASGGKVLAGTDLLWGKGFYKEGVGNRRANRAYGLGGEMMLNFGPYAVPVAYALWGFMVGRFRRYTRSIQARDLRLFMVPYLVWFIPNMLAWDLDNWVAHSTLRAFIPMLIVWLMAAKVRNRTPLASGNGPALA